MGEVPSKLMYCLIFLYLSLAHATSVAPGSRMDRHPVLRGALCAASNRPGVDRCQVLRGRLQLRAGENGLQMQ